MARFCRSLLAATNFLFVAAFISFSSGSNADEVNAPAKRIIALAPHIVESLFEIGAGDKIVATVDYADYPKQALSIPRIGGYYGVQMEKVLALAPDLVIVWKNGNRAEDIQKLEQLGLNIAYSEPKHITGVADELIHLGQLTGHELQATEAANRFLTRLDAIKTQYVGKAKINAFYQLWSEPLMTVNKNTWIHQLLTVCQANNVFAETSTDYPQVSIENVVVANPELIIQPDEKADKPQPKIDWHKWPMIPAVKQAQFIRINADLIHRFSSRMLDGVDDMCRKIDQLR